VDGSRLPGKLGLETEHGAKSRVDKPRRLLVLGHHQRNPV
jgi:hypothetical protein